jgi:long-chain acyl-CoA synthetase
MMWRGDSIFDAIRGRRLSDAEALIGENVCTYRDLVAAAESFAARLSEQGAERGLALACALPHGREYVTALLGTRFAGMVFIPVNPRAPQQERDRTMADSGSAFALLADAAGPPPACEPAQLSVEGESLWCMSPSLRRRYSGDDALVIYTSGSTGNPKGVLLSDTAISANVTAVADYLSLAADDRIVVFTPPSFAYAVNQVLTHLLVGGAIFPWREGLLNPLALLEAIAAAKATGLQANPSIFQALLRLGDAAPVLGDIRYVMSGGQPLATPLARQLRRLCPNARIVNMYGCTENAPRISYKWLPDDFGEDRLVWPVGKPVAGTEIAILDEAGEPVSDGETGEIAIRGTSLMRGYVGLPQAMPDRMRGSWFLTRDLGFIDAAGDLVLSGRADNVILVGHEKVSPEEVEALLLEVAGIEDAAVGPVEDASLFEIPVALLVLSAPLAEVEAAARKGLSKEVTRAKVPRRFFAVDAIPRTPYGKVDRVMLRQRIRDAMSR